MIATEPPAATPRSAFATLVALAFAPLGALAPQWGQVVVDEGTRPPHAQGSRERIPGRISPDPSLREERFLQGKRAITPADGIRTMPPMSTGSLKITGLANMSIAVSSTIAKTYL